MSNIPQICEIHARVPIGNARPRFPRTSIGYNDGRLLPEGIRVADRKHKPRDGQRKVYGEINYPQPESKNNTPQQRVYIKQYRLYCAFGIDFNMELPALHDILFTVSRMNKIIYE